MRRHVSICLVLWGLSTAHAALRTPCGADAPPAIQALATRLATTRDRAALARLAEDAAALGQAGTGAACAAYVAGSAWFFLSATGPDRRFQAARGVAHLVRAQALDPEGMAGVQPQSRLREAWMRVGDVPGWLEGGPIPIEFTGEGTLELGPANAGAWKQACGQNPTCDGAATIEVPLRGATTLTLRPGQYRWTHSTDCGRAHGVGSVFAPIRLIPPTCTRKVKVRDGDIFLSDFKAFSWQGGPVGEFLPVGEEVRIQAPGYREARFTVPRGEGEVDVALTRCEVELQVATTPADARVEGAGRGPWGPREVRLSRPGYDDLVTRIEVPARCGAAVHEVGVALSRPVQVEAHHGRTPITLARLWIQGEAVDPAAFSRPPGQYGYHAEHPRLGTTVGIFTVPPCETGTCAPARLGVLYERSGKAGPWVMLAGAGLAALAGGIFGVAALETDQAIDDYTVRRSERQSIAALVDERNQQATLANLGFGLGAALAVGATLWLWGGE